MTGRDATSLLIACSITIGSFGLLVALLALTKVTATATSPDEQWKAELVDRRLHFIDRNFRLRLTDSAGNEKVVFLSPDESPSGIGTERLLWSSDSRRLLVVGKKFWTREGVQLSNGEYLYLLYDMPTGKVWCNSDQGGPPFGPAELAGYDFGEPLTITEPDTMGTRMSD